MSDSKHTRTCCWPGCTKAGEYPAPRQRQMPVSYQAGPAVMEDQPLERDYYCLEHIREFNKGWDFFSGMTQAEIEQFQKDAMTGHRRTWKISERLAKQMDAIYSEAHRLRTGQNYQAQARTMPSSERVPTPEEREAMAVLGVDFPFTKEILKKHYHALVKRFHPDHHKDGNEEALKIINQAYEVLRSASIPA